jgi:5-methylcytosine-specific restriction endonuclease McrA
MDAQGYTIDHVTPISLGGADTIDNVRSAHRVCNLRRGARVEEMELANG